MRRLVRARISNQAVLALISSILVAGAALAHDGPRDGHLAEGSPPGPWHRLLHDCADDYGQHAGSGLTQPGHGLVSLDIREVEVEGEARLVFYLVLDKQHPLLRDHPTREAIRFETPGGPVETSISRLADGTFVHAGGLLPFSVAGPLVVIDLEDAAGPDAGRYAVELAYRHVDLGLHAGDAVRAFRVAGETMDAARTRWMDADVMPGGFFDPVLGPLLGPNPGCDPETDDDAYEAESFVLALGS